MRSFLALVGVAVIINAIGFSAGSPRRYQPGILVHDTPSQVEAQLPPFQFHDYVITPLANYKVTGRVIARNSYWFGREADLSPLDLGVAWGEMSDQSVLDNFRFNISMRYLRWSADKLELPLEEIDTQVSNNHIIPANDDVAKRLSKISVSDLVELKGKLVRVDAADGWHWQSSLSRNDTGDGACEVFFVEAVRKLPTPSKAA